MSRVTPSHLKHVRVIQSGAPTWDDQQEHGPRLLLSTNSAEGSVAAGQSSEPPNWLRSPAAALLLGRSGARLAVGPEAGRLARGRNIPRGCGTLDTRSDRCPDRTTRSGVVETAALRRDQRRPWWGCATAEDEQQSRSAWRARNRSGHQAFVSVIAVGRGAGNVQRRHLGLVLLGVGLAV